ncbi:MAG: bifunctional phosphoglucose/phosphomannose isomerase [Acidobacteriota bacterium]
MSEILDDPEEIRRLDQEGMLTILQSFDQQLEEALEIGLQAKLSTETRTIQNILVCGLGGSAIGGDFLRAYLGTDLNIPLLVNRNYSIPGFVDESTLALLCSYSGNTEETISAFHEAHQASCRIICLSSDGQIRRLANDHNYPCLQIPGGLPPRTAWGYSAIPLLVVFSRLGLISDRCDEVRRSLSWVRTRIALYGLDSPTEENAAKKLALDVYEKVPIIYGSQDRLEMVATRWRGQFCENGKQLAYSSSLPEMNHNEIVGWKHPARTLRQFVQIFLRDRDDHPRVQLRAEITREFVAENLGSCLEYWTEGETWLERLWTLILLGDYASVYLAFLNQENPTPVAVIQDLKNRLKEHQ